MPGLFNLPTTKSVNASNKVIITTPTHIIIDANGTIAAIDDCLIGSDAYYYVERNLKDFLIHFWYDKNIANAVNKLKQEYTNDKKINTNSKCPKMLQTEEAITNPNIAAGVAAHHAQPGGLSLDAPHAHAHDTITTTTTTTTSGANAPTGQGGATNADTAAKLISTLQSTSLGSGNTPTGTAGTGVGTIAGATASQTISGPVKTASSTSALSSSGLISSQPSSSSLPVRLAVPEDEVQSVVEHVLWRLRENRISPATRILLEHVLFQAYDRGSLKMLIYEEVPAVLNDWRMVKGIKLISFSRGSSDSQKCYFKSTTRGNISKLFSHFIDGTDKMSPNTDMFKKILDRIKEKPENVLYITNSWIDADTATKCQMNVILVEREDTSDSLFSQQSVNAKHDSGHGAKLGSKSNERLAKSAKIKGKDKIRVIKTLTEVYFKKGR